MTMSSITEPTRSSLLYQDEVWLDGSGMLLLVSEMRTGHVLNLLGWMLRNATSLQARAHLMFFVSSGGSHGEAAQDALDSMSAEFDLPAEVWIRRLPLFQAAARLCAERLGAIPAEMPHDGTVGMARCPLCKAERHAHAEALLSGRSRPRGPRPGIIAGPQGISRAMPPSQFDTEKAVRDRAWIVFIDGVDDEWDDYGEVIAICNRG
jgi:hypothetical protein